MASREGVYRVSAGRYSRYGHGSGAECGDGNSCGQYAYSVLTISEDAGEYRISPDSFQPALSRWFVQEDEPVRFWYTGGPLVDNNIVAIAVGTETYLTDDYILNPEVADAERGVTAVGPAVRARAAMALDGGRIAVDRATSILHLPSHAA